MLPAEISRIAVSRAFPIRGLPPIPCHLQRSEGTLQGVSAAFGRDDAGVILAGMGDPLDAIASRLARPGNEIILTKRVKARHGGVKQARRAAPSHDAVAGARSDAAESRPCRRAHRRRRTR